MSQPVAVVTGANSGIGRATAIHLAKNGYSVFGTVRSMTKATKVLAMAEDHGAELQLIELDIASDDSVSEGMAQILRRAGRVDVLVNNAGVGGNAVAEECPPSMYLDVMNTNLCGAVRCIQAVLPGMRERGSGCIVNITSSSVKAPIDILGLSNGARSGLTGFVAGVARTTIRHGVTINGLLPGPFDTDRLRGTTKARAVKAGRSFEEEYAAGAKAHPAGRFGTAEEFGMMCAFLCSVHAGYMTGQNILMDGGQYPGTY